MFQESIKPTISRKLLLGSAVLWALSGSISAQAQSADGSFGQCDARAWVTQDTGDRTRLTQLDTATAPFTVAQRGEAARYSGAAYSSTDNFIYGMRGNKLVRVGASGDAKVLGEIRGLPSGARVRSGTVAGYGFYYAAVAGSSDRLYRVDLGSRTAFPVRLERAADIQSLTTYKGTVYALETNGNLVEIPVRGANGNAVAVRPVSSANMGITSILGSANGLFGTDANANFYEYDLQTGSLEQRAASSGIPASDIVHCPDAPLAFDSGVARDYANVDTMPQNTAPAALQTQFAQEAPDDLPGFGNCPATLWVTEGSPTALAQIDQSGSAYQYIDVGESNRKYNASAFRQADGYVYGLDGGNNLIRVGSNGQTRLVGQVRNLPQGVYNAGDIGSDDIYYVKQAGSNGNLQMINISTGTATALPLRGASPNLTDLAWSNGMLYGVGSGGDAGWVFAIDPATGDVTRLTENNSGIGGEIALFGAANGIFGAAGDGNFYQFDTSTGLATRITPLPGTSMNDGVHCNAANVEIRTDVFSRFADDRDTFVPGQRQTFELVVGNDNNLGVQGAMVNMPQPDGVARMSWTCRASGGAVCQTPNGTGPIEAKVNLNSETSFTIVQETAPDARAVRNRAVTRLPEGYTDTSPANNVALDINRRSTGRNLLEGRELACDSRSWLAQNADTGVFEINTNANPFEFILIGDDGVNVQYNALAYNPVDNFLYALRRGDGVNRELLRIDNDGTFVSLGIIETLPTGVGFNAGDISPDGIYYVQSRTDSPGSIFAIDLNDLANLTATRITLSRTSEVDDYGWFDGFLWGVQGNNPSFLMKVDPVSAQVEAIRLDKNTGSPTGGMIGAPNGIFGVTNNGRFLQFDPENATFTDISEAPPSNTNDAAHCVTQDFTLETDISVTKDDGSLIYEPGQPVVYTITVTNEGPFGVQGAVVSDPLPEGITEATYTCTTTGGATCNNLAGGVLVGEALSDVVSMPVGSTITYELTIQVPADFTGELENTVTVEMPAGFTDPTPENNTATDVDVAPPTLVIEKVSVGGTGEFAFTGTNGVAAETLTTLEDGVPVQGAVNFLDAQGVETTVTESTIAAGYTLTDISCTGLADGGTATADLSTATVTLDAAATADGAAIVCTFTNAKTPILRLQKEFPEGRKRGDQVTLAIDGDNGATVETTGNGPTVTETVVVDMATPGGTYTFSETPAGSLTASDYTSTYSCENALAGGQAPSGSGTSFSITAAPGDDLTCTFSNVVEKPIFGQCSSGLYLSQNNPTDLIDIDVSTNPFTFPVLGTAEMAYNAMGYNPVDDRLYALDINLNLIQVLPDGSTVELVPVTGIDDANAGTFGPDGTYYVKRGGSNRGLATIDLETGQATVIQLSIPIVIADLAWYEGFLWAGGAGSDAGKLIRIDPNTGAVTGITGNSGANGDFGAMFGGTNGVFGAVNEGGFYQFDTETGAATLISGSPASGANDGANCPLAPIEFEIDLSVTKTDNMTLYQPGTQVTYDIVVTNNGPFGVQNAVVNDELPAGITEATWTCTPAGGATCGAPNGTGAINDTPNLPVDATVTYTYTITVPEDYTGDLENTVTVDVPEGFTDPTPENNTATDIDQQTPSIIIEKVTVGGTGTFQFTGSNGVPAVELTTTEDGVPVQSDPIYLTEVNVETTITESGLAADYILSDITCTGLGAGGTATEDLGTATVTLDPAAVAPGAQIVCTFTNTQNATDLAVEKTASPDPVESGEVITYTITVDNLGPLDATDALLTDTPSAGLDCAAPVPATAECTATGGAVCPAAPINNSDLTGGGVTIPSLPVGGEVVFTVQCTVTATGQ